MGFKDWIAFGIIFIAIIWAAAVGGLPYVFLLVMLCAVYVYADAKKRGLGPQPGQKESMESRSWSPISWAVLTFLVWIIFFPLYLLKREEYSIRTA